MYWSKGNRGLKRGSHPQCVQRLCKTCKETGKERLHSECSIKVKTFIALTRYKGVMLIMGCTVLAALLRPSGSTHIPELLVGKV